MAAFVGLDCGGSSSRALAVAPDGEVLFQGQSGAANLATTPEGRLRRNLAAAVRGCPPPSHVAGCFAGLVNADTRERGLGILRELFPQARVVAYPDYAAAFHSCPPGTDVCVVAGTGSLVCSQKAGEMVKSGGGGYLLGDPGSAYRYGLAALRHWFEDPEEATPSLRGGVAQLFDTEALPDVVAGVYRLGAPAGTIAKLAKPFAADVRMAEPYAMEALRAESAALAAVIARHLRLHFPSGTPVQIGLVGGVWKIAPFFRERLEEALSVASPESELRLVRTERPPLHGAVALARRLAQA